MMPNDAFERSARQRRRRAPVWKIVLAMLGAGVLTWWLSVWLISPALRAGVPEALAIKLPIAGFVLGTVIGFIATFSLSLKQIASVVLAPVLCGAVFWFFAVLAGGMLVAAGVSERVADTVATAAFWFGVLLGIIPGIAIAADRLDVLAARFGIRRKG